MISIVNYGLGNVKAFKNIYDHLGIAVSIASSEKELNDAEKLILPGVGSFDSAMKKLINSGMYSLLNEKVMKKNTPVLGICIGMQIMCKASEEGTRKGLGWVKANVKSLKKTTKNEKLILPHMGWNTVNIINENGIFSDINENDRFYFLHSYYVDIDKNYILAETNYGIDFASSFCVENLFGIQFHPEKSHDAGIKILKYFAEL